MAWKGALGAAVGAGLLLTSCSAATPTPAELTVAAYNFDESRLVGEIYSVVLENAGITVKRDYNYATREVVGKDFADGSVDVVPEYLGSVTETVNSEVNGEAAQPIATGDPAQTAEALRGLVEPFGVVATDPAGAQNQLQFAVRGTFAQENGLATLGDLAKLNGQLIFGGPVGCTTAASCLPGLQQVYGLQFANVVLLDTGGQTTLNALQSGQVDVGMVFATDPAVSARGLVVLADDKQLQVADNIIGLVASQSASDEVVQAVDGVAAALTTDELRALNGQVTIEGYPIEFVAARWAAGKGLIPAEAVPATPVPTPPPTYTTPPPPPPPAPEPGLPPVSAGYDRNRGEPSANARSRNWDRLAKCESGGDPTIISSNGLYHGLYQFSVPTWQSMGGRGAASSASADEQTYRAQILYDASGRGQWPVCGKYL